MFKQNWRGNGPTCLEIWIWSSLPNVEAPKPSILLFRFSLSTLPSWFYPTFVEYSCIILPDRIFWQKFGAWLAFQLWFEVVDPKCHSKCCSKLELSLKCLSASFAKASKCIDTHFALVYGSRIQLGSVFAISRPIFPVIQLVPRCVSEDFDLGGGEERNDVKLRECPLEGWLTPFTLSAATRLSPRTKNTLSLWWE